MTDFENMLSDDSEQIQVNTDTVPAADASLGADTSVSGADASGTDLSSYGSQDVNSVNQNQEQIESASQEQPQDSQVSENTDSSASDFEQEVASTEEYTLDDIYKLLSEQAEKQDSYQKEVLENQKQSLEQSKDLLSVSTAILLAIGLLSGILLARVVWRKL